MTRNSNREYRNINGILLLKKPSGITSNDALQKIKKLFYARKAGHTGSLDKPATGMLPIFFGEATKFTSYLINADKYYYTRCQLGAETTTGDAAGEITGTNDVPTLIEKPLTGILSEFKGDIAQVPPMYSALKHKGQRLYKLAYKGIEVERKKRLVRIYDIKLINFTKDQLEIELHCSKGTYVRTLVEDIGRRIGCGAHVHQLIRTRVGDFAEDEMWTIDELIKLSETRFSNLLDVLLPVDSVVNGMPEVTLTHSSSSYITNGQSISVPNAPSKGMLRMYNQNHDFLGIGEVLKDGRIAPRRLVNL